MNVLLAVAEKSCDQNFSSLAPATQVAIVIMAGLFACVFAWRVF